MTWYGRQAFLAAAILAATTLSLGSAAGAAQLYILAVNWQPAFCETRQEKPECASQTEDRFDASHFALHGLWPQPDENVYCGVRADLRALDEAGGWRRLPPLDLTDQTRAALDRVMPGTASFLDRHEWVKHGTCHADTAEAYYRDSLRLMEELNASPVRTLFAESIGSPVSAAAIRAKFEEAYGLGAGDRVHVICRRIGVRRLIVELKINVAGPLTPDRDFGTVLQEAPVAFEGCRAGIVDRVGTGITER